MSRIDLTVPENITDLIDIVRFKMQSMGYYENHFTNKNSI